MGPQAEDYIETVLTCEGDFYDPDFHARLQNFSKKLEELILQDHKKKKLILKKVEPWNSVRVTFNIPKEAALRLKCLAEQGDATLKELGILAVEIEGDRKISLKIAGKNNETTELIFRTSLDNTMSNSTAFEVSSDDVNLPGPSHVENTRKNIQDYLGQDMTQHLSNYIGASTQPSKPVAMSSGHIGMANHNSTQGQAMGILSQMSPKFPTPPPSVSTPNSPNAALITGIGNATGNQNIPANNQMLHMVKQLLGNKSPQASPLLVNLLQNESSVNMQFNNAIPKNFFPQAMNNIYQQTVNRAQMSLDPTNELEPPPKKKRKPRKPKDKDANKKDKMLQNPSENTVIQSLLQQAAVTSQQDLRVPPINNEQSPIFAGTPNTPSKNSSPSSSRAATPSKSPFPPPRSPLLPGYSLAPGQRQILNPSTGQLEVVEEDVGLTPPKRDFPNKDMSVHESRLFVPQNPTVAFSMQNNNLQVANDCSSAMSRNSTSKSPTAALNSETIWSREHFLAPLPESKYQSDTGLASGYTGHLINTSSVQTSASTPQIVSELPNPSGTLTQSVSAILSNVSRSGNMALATLNSNTLQDSSGITMQSKTVCLPDLTQSNTVQKSAEHLDSLPSTVSWSAVSSTDHLVSQQSNSSTGILRANSLVSTSLCVSSTSSVVSSTSKCAFVTNSDTNSIQTAVSYMSSSTSQITGSTGINSQVTGAKNANILSMGPSSSALNSCVNGPTVTSVQNHSLNSESQLTPVSEQTEDSSTKSFHHSSMNSMDETPHPQDSEHSNQSCDEHGKQGSASVDSGLGDIKDNNGESPCTSSGNDSPGVTVSSSGNRDSDGEKDIPHSEPNVITVGYVMSESDNPKIVAPCDSLIKCNRTSVSNKVSATIVPENCDKSLTKQSVLNSLSVDKTDSISNLHDTTRMSLNWKGRSDLNPGGSKEKIGNFNTTSSGSADTKDRVDERSSLVQVCSNDAEVLTGSQKGSPNDASEQESSIDNPTVEIISENTEKVVGKQSEIPCIKTTADTDVVKSVENSTASSSVHNIESELTPIGIDSISEIKVTGDNTLIINTKLVSSIEKLPNSNQSIADQSDNGISSASSENSIANEASNILSKIKTHINPGSSTQKDLMTDTSRVFPTTSVEYIEKRPQNIVMPLLMPNGIMNNNLLANSNSLEGPGILSRSNGPLALYSPIIHDVANNSSTCLEIKTGINGNKYLFETHKMSVDSNLNVELPSKSVVMQELLSNLSSSISNMTHQKILNSVDNQTSNVSPMCTITSVSPSLRNITSLTSGPGNVFTSINSRPNMMAGLGPTPIMSTGLSYLNNSTSHENDNQESLDSDKGLKSTVAKGISIMKPLRDRECSLDEDLDSPVKKAAALKKTEQVIEKPTSVLGLNKRANFTVAQLLDEADKGKQVQPNLQPLVASDNPLNLIPTVGITASEKLKQIAKNVNESFVSEKQESTVNNTVPKLIKLSSDYVANCVVTPAVSTVGKAVHVTNSDNIVHHQSVAKLQLSNSALGHKHMTITAPDFPLNLTESVHQAMNALHTPPLDSKSSKSSVLVNIPHTENRAITKDIGNSVSLKPSAEVVSTSSINCESVRLQKSETETKNTQESKPALEFIKIEPTNLMQSPVKNLIIKSSPEKINSTAIKNTKTDIPLINNLVQVSSSKSSSEHPKSSDSMEVFDNSPSGTSLSIDHSYASPTKSPPSKKVVLTENTVLQTSGSINGSSNLERVTVFKSEKKKINEESSLSTFVPKSSGKVVREQAKTLTITGVKTADSKEVTRVTLDLRSAVTGPSAKFIRIEPGGSSVNRHSSPTSLKIHEESNKSEHSEKSKTVSKQEKKMEDKKSTSKSEKIVEKVESGNGTIACEEVPSENGESIEETECKNNSSQPRINETVAEKSKETESHKVPARIIRRSSRSSTDSRASSTDGHALTDDTLSTPVTRNSRKRCSQVKQQELNELLENESVKSRRSSTSSMDRPLSPMVNSNNNKSIRNNRRKVTEYDKSPERQDDSVLNDSNTRATRSSKRKIQSSHENTDNGKRLRMDEQEQDVTPGKKDDDFVEAVKKSASKNKPVRTRQNSISSEDTDLGSETKESTTNKRSTRSTRSVEHCELPNNYLTKKKPRTA